METKYANNKKLTKKKRPSIIRILMYILIAIIVFNWIYKSPEEKKEEIEEKITDYTLFESHCITYTNWNVGRGGNKNINELYADPQECLEKELFIWQNDGSEITRGTAVLVFNATNYSFSDEELNDDDYTDEEIKYEIIRDTENECESTLLGGFGNDFYTNGEDYIIEDMVSGEKSKMRKDEFDKVFKITRIYTNKKTSE